MKRAGASLGLAMGALAALTGCATVDAQPAQRLVGATHPCKADEISDLTGRKATTALGSAIRQRTAASIFQWVPPDTAVTMDFRPDRVRVSYDRDMIVTAIRCG